MEKFKVGDYVLLVEFRNKFNNGLFSGHETAYMFVKDKLSIVDHIEGRMLWVKTLDKEYSFAALKERFIKVDKTDKKYRII